MNVMIMGAGGQGAPCASILVRDADVKEVRLCDINEELLSIVAAKIRSPKLVTAKVNAANIEEIVKAAKGMDVIVDLVTPVFFFNVYKAALKAGVHYVNTAWEEFLYEGFEDENNDNGKLVLGAKLKLSDQFANKGLTAVLGSGCTSGYNTNVVIRYHVDMLDTVESIKIRLAKKDANIPSEEEILHPWNPGWNPRQALLDFVVPTYKFENNEYIKMTQLFSEPEIWDFPEPIGKTMVAHHAHEEPFCLPEMFADKGLKYCDFKYYVNKQLAPIVMLGLGQEEKINVKGVEVSPLDVVLHFVPNPGDAFLNEDPSKFSEQDRTNLYYIVNEIIGKKNGQDVKFLVDVFNPNAPRQQLFDNYGTSQINVALPAAIAAKMVVEGTKKGTISPHEMDPNRFIALIEKSGYPRKWKTRTFINGKEQ